MIQVKSTTAPSMRLQTTISFPNGNSITAWKHQLPDVIREILTLQIEAFSEGHAEMNMKFELSEVDFSSEFDASKMGFIREIIAQYMAAGILFPEEVRHAEKILRRLSTRK